MEAFDAYLHENVVVETGLSPAGPIEGREAYKQIFSGFADAWPVRKFEIVRIDEADEVVVIEFVATCEFAKDYYGVAAKKQVVPLREMHRLQTKMARSSGIPSERSTSRSNSSCTPS